MFKTFILFHTSYSSLFIVNVSRWTTIRSTTTTSSSSSSSSSTTSNHPSIHPSPPGLSPIAHLVKGVDAVTNPPEDLQVATNRRLGRWEGVTQLGTMDHYGNYGGKLRILLLLVGLPMSQIVSGLVVERLCHEWSNQYTVCIFSIHTCCVCCVFPRERTRIFVFEYKCICKQNIRWYSCTHFDVCTSHNISCV